VFLIFGQVEEAVLVIVRLAETEEMVVAAAEQLMQQQVVLD
jgi:hypothetical protein